MNIFILTKLSEILSLAKVCELAGLNINSIRTKIKRKYPLTENEVFSIEKALNDFKIKILYD